MPIILSNHRLRIQLPQPGIVIAARGNQIRAIGAKRTIPHPPLMALETRLDRKRRLRADPLGRRVSVAESTAQGVLGVGEAVARAEGRFRRCGHCGGGIGDDAPDSGVVVCAAGREVAHVRREENAGDVGLVGGEFADGDQGGDVTVLLELPDENGALRFWLAVSLLRNCSCWRLEAQM